MSFKNDKNLNVSGWFGKSFQYSDGDTSDFVGSSSTLYCYFTIPIKTYKFGYIQELHPMQMF